MAANNNDDDLDLAVDQESGSKKKLILLIAAGVLLVLIAGGAIAWFLLAGGDEENAEEVAEAVEAGPAIYHPMEPGFVVNLPAGSKAKLLQAEIQIVARDQATIDFVKLNDPMIRHNLLNLLGASPDSELRSRQGKEKLQAAVLKQLNKLLKDQGGSGEIEAVYFTSFVMQ
jgi:flagellar FliL protein